MENKVCYDCEANLTKENTSEFGGLDSGNFYASHLAGFGIPAEMFMKCDDCHNADVDRHLDNQYN